MMDRGHGVMAGDENLPQKKGETLLPFWNETHLLFLSTLHTLGGKLR